MNFHELLRRFTGHLRERVRSGEVSERRLARLTGVSQPHLHHVLGAKRQLSMDKADEMLRRLHMDILDLIEPREMIEWRRRH